MRVLILGGTGFLGPQIAERLAASGHEITIFHRDPTGAGSGLSYDHRVIDGAPAVRFLQRVKLLLEKPGLMLSS